MTTKGGDLLDKIIGAWAILIMALMANIYDNENKSFQPCNLTSPTRA